MIEIGNRIETPEGVFYELEYGGEGNIYKNEDAFLNRPDEVCYVPEYAAEDREDWRVSESSDGCFTHNSLLALCIFLITSSMSEKNSSMELDSRVTAIS